MNDPGPYYRPPGMDDRARPRRIRRLPIAIGLAFVVAATLILLLLLSPASFGLAPSSYPYRYGLFGGAFLLFFLLLVAFFIVRVLFWSTRASRYGRRYGPGAPGEYGPNRPAMIARMRYARGEITREQYDQLMQDLARRPGAP
jgi:uncharacterized membrane protein